MTRIGVIGIGSMGENHVRLLSGIRGADLVGVYDVSEKRSEEISKKYNVKSFQSMDELIGLCDGLIIASTTTTHYKIAKECLSKGKHVLIEKPICDNIENAKDLLNIAKKNNVILGVGHIEEYNPAIKELHKVILDQEILNIDCSRLSPVDNRSTDVDVVLDLMIHDLGIILNIVKSKIKKTNSMGIKSPGGNVNMCVSQISFDNGTIANITSSKISQQKLRKLTVNCRNFSVNLDYMAKTVELYKTNFSGFAQGPNEPSYKQDMVIQKIMVSYIEPLKAEIEDFLNAIANDKDMIASGIYGLNALEVAIEIKANMSVNILK